MLSQIDIDPLQVFNDATTLDTTMDILDPQPTLVECLVRPLLLPRERLPQIGMNLNGLIGINSNE
jgi:hypothetical protein